jgi:ribosomal peptide maturation radical SAM protein 1
MAMIDVLLVSMPFGDAFSPSMGLSLLQPQVRSRGLTCKILYPTVMFAETIGQGLYHGLSTNRNGSVCDLIGEWMFSDAVFARKRHAERSYVRDILIDGQAWPNHASVRSLSEARIAAILRAKRHVPAFLDACVARVCHEGPRILGFTSVFQQHVASLALAKRVKACRPETLIVFGGANCESVMGAETIRQFPFVDAVVSGEGDLAFPDLAARFIDGGPIDDLPGVITRRRIRRIFAFGQFPHTPAVSDLDALPYPDFSDYFSEFNRTRLARDWRPSIFVETSRGCWWGERQHCTFCGLNGATMTFRSKSADRALEEFRYLAKTYPGSFIQVVDNILDLKYFGTLLPALAREQVKFRLFYETKSNLKKDQVRLLRDAGVTTIQPGIESLSDQVLALMKKGVSAMQNIRLLKWCKQFGVEPQWNVLFGFPGESPDEYRRVADMVPALAHLPGPVSAGEIRLDRFSPNYFDAARLGFDNVRPLAPYRFIYDFPEDVLKNLAYYFAYDYQQPTDVLSYVRRLLPRLQAWRGSWRRVELLSIDHGGLLTLIDTRPMARAPLTVLHGHDREMYLACDDIAPYDSIARKIVDPAGTRSVDPAERLALMVARGVMIRDGQRYLALAVPLGPDYASSGAGATRIVDVLSRVGRRSPSGTIRVPIGRSEFQLEGQRLRYRSTARPDRRRLPRRSALRLTPSSFHVAGQFLVVRPQSAPN